MVETNPGVTAPIDCMEPFMDVVPSISLRENERGAQTGAGSNPTWHTPLDVWTPFTDQDFRLGLNAAQTTLGAVSRLTGVRTEP
jgi:hypothetical protein